MREGARAAPAPARASLRIGGLSRRLRLWGHDSNQQQALVSSQQPARGAPRRARWRNARLTDLHEELLWARIRGRRLGVVFRRQVPLLGRFIADFLAPEQRLVIEVDGAYHGERAAADARRDAALERAGYRVVRLEASLVVSDIELALSAIRAALA